eukprot:CAMPEP_0173127350 /NCGR_PEP_ID=MMETSP1102-20130122/57734_1 /TAXON_ID=49646 /ORGANISM="Geminigera sp., Strain Caron Lab Isolate" /LENGTH=89 /DNA_ID=CAMNT_0014036941 /DNA_START=110 /DNA_END=376 /DNA_ORIENTATION=+
MATNTVVPATQESQEESSSVLEKSHDVLAGKIVTNNFVPVVDESQEESRGVFEVSHDVLAEMMVTNLFVRHQPQFCVRDTFKTGYDPTW